MPRRRGRPRPNHPAKSIIGRSSAANHPRRRAALTSDDGRTGGLDRADHHLGETRRPATACAHNSCAPPRRYLSAHPLPRFPAPGADTLRTPTAQTRPRRRARTGLQITPPHPRKGGGARPRRSNHFRNPPAELTLRPQNPITSTVSRRFRDSGARPLAILDIHEDVAWPHPPRFDSAAEEAAASGQSTRFLAPRPILAH